MDAQCSWKNYIMPILSEKIREEIHDCDCDIEEIRVCVNREVRLRKSGQEILTGCIASLEDCRILFENICRHSLYAFEEELRECYVTLDGGYRVGIAGMMLPDKKGSFRMVAPSGFNIRIAREIIGSAQGIMPHLDRGGTSINSVLLISPPGAGKTTVLRDAARQLSNRGHKVCIADERNELSGSVNGIPTLDVGKRTDVMSGCSKAVAMGLMIRMMSPEIIVTDEISGPEDASAILDAAGCGVKILASAHADGYQQLKKRQNIRLLLSEGCFDQVILMNRKRENVTFKAVGES